MKISPFSILVLFFVAFVFLKEKKYSINFAGKPIDVTGIQKRTSQITTKKGLMKSFLGSEAYDNRIGKRVFNKYVAQFFDILSQNHGVSKNEEKIIEEVDFTSNVYIPPTFENIDSSEEEEEAEIYSTRRTFTTNPCSYPYPKYSNPYSVYTVTNHTYYTCNGENTTEANYNIQILDSESDCKKTNYQEYECLCHDTRSGTKCQSWRKSKCDIELVDPLRDCLIPNGPGLYEEGGMKLFGYLNCLRYNSTETKMIDLTFQMNCQYTDPPTVIAEDKEYRIADTNEEVTYKDVKNIFKYWLREVNTTNNETIFSLKYSLKNYPIWMKHWDFDSLGKTIYFDKQYVLNDPDIFIGKKNFTFSFNFSEINSTYFIGNRFYAEVGFDWGGIPYRNSEKLFFDFDDLNYPIVINIPWVWIGVISSSSVLGTIFVVGVISYMTYQYIKRRKKHHKYKL